MYILYIYVYTLIKYYQINEKLNIIFIMCVCVYFFSQKDKMYYRQRVKDI